MRTLPPTNPELESPATSMMPPEVDTSELPVARVSDPDAPALEVPVESAIAPLAPFWPAFCVEINICPLLVCCPRPEVKNMPPPVVVVEAPASMTTCPPTLLPSCAMRP